MTGTVALLVPASPERFDGVRDFARDLRDALAPALRVEVVTTRADAAPLDGARVIAGWRRFDVSPGTRAIIVNYLPTAWLRSETIGLMRTLRRFRKQGGTVIVVVHEYQIDSDGSLRRAAARAAFRALARAFARRADAVVVTHGLAVRRLHADGVDRLTRVVLLPAGSTIPMAEPALVAAAHGGSPQSGVVMFGQPAFMDAAAVRAVARALAEAGAPPLRWICRNAEELRRWMATAGIADTDVVIRARLDVHDASRELLGSALAFAPITDGVSTRRTTVITFLHYGLPIVGVKGPATDDLLEQSGAFALTSQSDADGMATHVLRLLADAGSRERMSAAGRRLFDEQLAWPRIGRKYLELIA
ncbi:MAG: hypothetical protein M3Q55_01445 [Acidobacteriota bacterium]|nr:hypothetical protein [Acidobacteriota bacterium]